jgi:hypothetical protein
MIRWRMVAERFAANSMTVLHEVGFPDRWLRKTGAEGHGET